MINLFVTYRCNLACPYCFARPLATNHPEDISPERFAAFLEWVEQACVPAVAFLGGEPTLHPRLESMVRSVAATGAAAVLFTNGLFSPALTARLAPFLANVVVNLNPPSFYAPAQAEKLEKALEALRAEGARLTFSRNFSPGSSEWRYLLDAAARHGATAIRYDVSRPAVDRTNDHCREEDARALFATVVEFVRACEERGIRTGLDCSVRLCDLPEADRRYLESVSMKFRGVCHPSMDVHPDLSVSYCLPLHDLSVPDLTAFADEGALMRHFAQAVRPLRFERPPEGCAECADFLRRCQGGCLALRARDGETPA